jgi:hypothetical protein
MSRLPFLPIWLLLFFAIDARAQNSFPAGEPPQAGVMAVDRLPDQLKIRRQAASFDELVLRTKPQFVWNKQDMLWIMHDDAGNPVFAMNRAYSLSIGNAGSASYLLEAIDAYQDSANGPQFSYTRAVDTNPTIIASDPDGGVLYQVHWPSSLSEGDGGIILTRNIILYCDADHGWHFLLEGPTTARGIQGAYEYFSQCDLPPRIIPKPV